MEPQEKRYGNLCHEETDPFKTNFWDWVSNDKSRDTDVTGVP